MSLSEEAILVNMTISLWKARKYSKRGADAVDVAFDSAGAGNFIKKTIDQPELRHIQAVAQAARARQYAMTLPWDDKVWRLLPVGDFDKYAEEMRSRKTEFSEAVAAFVRQYHYIINKERGRLGNLFSENDYPEVDSVERKFSFVTGVRPLPDSGDIRVNAGKESVEEMRRMMEEESVNQRDRAVKEMYARLHGVVERVITRLSTEEPRVRETLIRYVEDMCDELSRMNKVIRDKHIDEMTRDIKSRLCLFTAEMLRGDIGARQEAIIVAKDIVDKMAAFV